MAAEVFIWNKYIRLLHSMYRQTHRGMHLRDHSIYPLYTTILAKTSWILCGSNSIARISKWFKRVMIITWIKKGGRCGFSSTAHNFQLHLEIMLTHGWWEAWITTNWAYLRSLHTFMAHCVLWKTGIKGTDKGQMKSMVRI